LKIFLPYEEIRNREVIMVDGSYARGLVLSHWKGSGSPPEAADDTSAGIVINALKLNLPGMDIPYVTANHFDIDGFIGVWALLNPGKALKNEKLLKHTAYIGDFREIDFNEPEWEKALKLCCWFNKVEKQKFYPPFGMWETEEAEFKACADKFRYFTEAFEDALENIDKYKQVWKNEFNAVLSGLEQVKKAGIEHHPAEGLIIVNTPRPVHYYSLFSFTKGFDTVLTLYSENRYELEYKYVTWVDIISRPVFPRIDLKPLLSVLNNREESGMRWFASKITDTGPVMRLDSRQLSYMELFQNPYEREIYSSSITQEAFKQYVLGFFKEAYSKISPKKHWTWKETRSLNNNSKIHNYIYD
jgi:hypothetical protein